MGVQAAEADPTTVAHSNPCEVELLEGDTRPALRVPHVHNAKRDPVKAADLVLQSIKEEIPDISAPLAATMGVAMKHHRKFLLELWKTENALAQSQDVELFMLGSMVQHQKNGRPFGEAEEEEEEDTEAGDNTLESEDSDDPDYEHERWPGELKPTKRKSKDTKKKQAPNRMENHTAPGQYTAHGWQQQNRG